MKLADLLSKPLAEVLTSGDLELREFKPHTNESGEIQCVELKYVPKGLTRDSDLFPVPPAFRSQKR